jgi:hypothetical protein
MLLLVFPVVCFAVSNETITPLPAAQPNASSYTQTRTFLRDELPAVLSRQFRTDFVVAGGVHGTSVTMTSPSFVTEAFTTAGNHVTGDGNGGPISINYSLVGCAATDTAYVIASAESANTLGNFVRSGTSNYFVDCTSTNPSLPANSVWLMQVTLSGGAITAVLRLGGKSIVSSSKFTTLQEAVDSLGPHGGTVMVEPGTHLITSTLTIGDGDVGVASTKEGIVLECIGQPGRSKTESATVLKYTGTAGLPLIAIKGPLVGWGVKNCYLDGNGLASTDLYVQSARGGDVSNLVMEGHTYAGIQSTCVAPFVGWNGATDSLRNRWAGIWIWHLPPAQSGSAGIVLNSSAATCNTDFNDFFSTSVLVAGVDGWGVYLGASDHNMFYNLHIYDSLVAPATRSGVHFAYDNGVYAGWPCANDMFGVSLGETGMSASGTPLANNTCVNSIFGLSGGDPANYIPNLPGVTAIYGDRVSADLILIAGRGSANTKPVGDVTIYTDASFPRHLVPLVDGVSDIGRFTGPYGAQRFKDLYLLGQVIHNQRGVVGDGVLDAQTDYYVQIANSAPSAFTLQTAAAPYGCKKEYVIKNLGGFNVTVAAFGAETIDGAANVTLTPAAGSSAIRITSDCVSWHIIGRD